MVAVKDGFYWIQFRGCEPRIAARRTIGDQAVWYDCCEDNGFRWHEPVREVSFLPDPRFEILAGPLKPPER